MYKLFFFHNVEGFFEKKSSQEEKGLPTNKVLLWEPK
jgi:hypothetical protein